MAAMRLGHVRCVRGEAPLLARDRDTKFSRSFDELVREDRARVIVTPFQAPNANAHSRARDRDDQGRVPRPDRHPEVGGISIGRSGPMSSTPTATALYSALGLAPPRAEASDPMPVSPRDVCRRDLLGGLIHEYYGAAA